MNVLRTVGALAGLALIVAGIRVVSHLPVSLRDSDNAMIRVALSARPERIEVCRTLSEEELANIPQHMRQPVVCEGHTAQYQLELRHNDSLLLSRTVRGGGLRNDRHLYVLHELPVAPGSSRIDVRMTRLDLGGEVRDSLESDSSVSVGNASSQQEEGRQRRREDEVPASLLFTEELKLGPREIVLVTYDRDMRSLRFERGTGRP